VVVIEREARILARVACPALSDFFTTYHRDRGVRIEVGATVVALDGDRDRVNAVELSDGRRIACDLVVVGIGARPNDEIAASAGPTCARGVVVDLEARTSDPDIFAIGDVSHRPLPIYDRMFRLENVPNALEQAKQAVAAIMGRPRRKGEVPWQWSDLYDLKLQIAGYPFDVDEVLLRGDPQNGSFAAFHMSGDLIQAVEAINAPPEFMMGKALIGARRPVDRTRLVDPLVSMKDVAQ